jgi:hypothetical protein
MMRRDDETRRVYEVRMDAISIRLMELGSLDENPVAGMHDPNATHARRWNLLLDVGRTWRSDVPATIMSMASICTRIVNNSDHFRVF